MAANMQRGSLNDWIVGKIQSERNALCFTAGELQSLYRYLRSETLSLNQIRAAVQIICGCDACDEFEIEDVLCELDRRNNLLNDLKWDFKLLNTDNSGLITEKDARLLCELAHGKCFSIRRWNRFLSNRPVPTNRIAFEEIEVELCSLPDSEWIDDILAEKQNDGKATSRKIDDSALLDFTDDLDFTASLEELLQHEVPSLPVIEKISEEEKKKNQAEFDKLIAEENERKKEEAVLNWKKAELLVKRNNKDKKMKINAESRKIKDKLDAEAAAEMVSAAVEEELKAEEDAKNALERARQSNDEEEKRLAEEAAHVALILARETKEKRLKILLKTATKSRDKTKLANAINETEDTNLLGLEAPLKAAKDVLNCLQAGDILKDAMLRRHLSDLVKAVDNIHKNKYEKHYGIELIEADKLTNKLKRLERLRKEILELNQSTISEIRSYQNPPIAVHHIMISTYLILSYKEKELKVWKNMQAFLGKIGKESLKRQCTQLDPLTIDIDIATYAENTYLKQHDINSIRDVSAGAATFYVWASSMIEEAKSVTEEDRIRRRAEIINNNKNQVDNKKPERERTKFIKTKERTMMRESTTVSKDSRANHRRKVSSGEKQTSFTRGRTTLGQNNAKSQPRSSSQPGINRSKTIVSSKTRKRSTSTKSTNRQ